MTRQKPGRAGFRTRLLQCGPAQERTVRWGLRWSREPLVVVGAGVAGTAAAIEAAKAGVRVTLIDENPVGASMMGLDVPLFFGQRIVAADGFRDGAAMLENVGGGQPRLGEGAEKRALRSCSARMRLGRLPQFRERAGSSTGRRSAWPTASRSWMIKFDRLIVAAGARDLGMGVCRMGAMPGAMGANGAQSLVSRYRCTLSSQRIVVLGSGNLGLQHSQDGAGCRGHSRFPPWWRCRPSVRGEEALLTDELRAPGAWLLYTSHTVREAAGEAGRRRVRRAGGDRRRLRAGRRVREGRSRQTPYVSPSAWSPT